MLLTQCNFSWPSQSKNNIKDFNPKVTYIIDKFRKVDYPSPFINNLKNPYIISSNLFKEQKPFIWIKIQFYDKN